MARLYKLTDRDGRTMGNTQWGDGVSHSGTGEGGLCGPGWIHAYEHPLIAVLMNPEHAGFDPDSMRLWEAEGEVGLREGQLKCGCKTLTTVREISVPEITTEMRVRFAILCVKEVCREAAWNKWADGWLSGEDRSEARAAEAASRAASRAASKASEAAWAAAWAASEVDLFAIAETACAG